MSVMHLLGQTQERVQGARFMANWQRYAHSPVLILALLAILALFIELFIFNSWAWYDRESYPRQELSLPLEQGIAITSAQRVLTIEDLDLPIQNIYVEMKSTQPQLVSVYVQFKDFANKDRFVGTNSVLLNAGGEYSGRFVHFDAHKGRIFGLQLAITQSTNAPLYLSKLVFNEDEPLRFSVLRFVLLCAVLMGGYGVFIRRWYCLRFDRSLRAHRWLDHGVMAVAVLWCVVLALCPAKS